MKKELKIQSIVVNAQSFNTTIFNRHWLVKNNFVDESEIQSDSIFAPNLTQVVTRKFNLLVVPEQLQFIAGPESTDFERDIESSLLPIINKLQDIPYKALGLNLNWFLKDEKKSMTTLTTDMFFNHKSDLFEYFNGDNSRFGAFLSKNFLNTCLKLDIKPVSLNMGDNSMVRIAEHIVCNFNFHLDLSNPDTAQIDIVETIKLWNEFKKESEKIIELL